MFREDRELLAGLKRVCNDAGLFALEYMASDLSIEAEEAYALRLVDLGERLLTHAKKRKGLVLDGEALPNDIQNTTGLRHDTAPHHAPPSTTATTACTAPDASSNVPRHHRKRCCPVTGRTASQTCRRTVPMAGDAMAGPHLQASPRRGHLLYPSGGYGAGGVAQGLSTSRSCRSSSRRRRCTRPPRRT